MYRKQFKIPEAHQNFIEQSLDEWLKLGVVKRANSLYSSPIFCVPKKQGQGLRVVQDFRELNNHSHIDKYSMKNTYCLFQVKFITGYTNVQHVIITQILLKLFN